MLTAHLNKKNKQTKKRDGRLDEEPSTDTHPPIGPLQRFLHTDRPIPSSPCKRDGFSPQPSPFPHLVSEPVDNQGSSPGKAFTLIIYRYIPWPAPLALYLLNKSSSPPQPSANVTGSSTEGTRQPNGAEHVHIDGHGSSRCASSQNASLAFTFTY